MILPSPPPEISLFPFLITFRINEPWFENWSVGDVLSMDSK